MISLFAVQYSTTYNKSTHVEWLCCTISTRTGSEEQLVVRSVIRSMSS